MSERLVLTPSERTSPLWVKLETHFKGRLEDKRIANDAVKSQAETDFLRGEIAQIKALLALGASRT